MTAGFVVAVTAVVIVGLACGAWRAVSTGEPAAGEGHWSEVRSRPGPGHDQGWRRRSLGAYPPRAVPGLSRAPVPERVVPERVVPEQVVQERAIHEQAVDQ